MYSKFVENIWNKKPFENLINYQTELRKSGFKLFEASFPLNFSS